MKSGKDIRILIVDDVSENIQVAMNILKEESYSFSFATNGEEAIALVTKNSFDLILLDIMMPKISGFDVCNAIKKMDHAKDIPIVFLTAKSDADSISKGFSLGGVDYIVKPFHADELIARVKTHVELSLSRQAIQKRADEFENKAHYQAIRLAEEIESSQVELIFILMEIMESTSDETGKHIKRVAEMCQLMASYVPFLNEEDMKTLFLASPMHDIGKIAIPKEILHKPGKLSPEEMTIMRTHAQKGYDLLKKSKRRLSTAAAIIAREHHEKWDGTGYPRGLKGEEIHIYGRIVGLVDVFDALTHKRQYKDAWPIDDAITYITEHSGSHFDPSLVAILTDHLAEFVAIIHQ
ncbi:HD domain-containing phosphohydrolase [Agaribacter flavus]|uniref:HD domain-containing phosphohydrolase n=1 Tax=Agaribacter flavus TaxID=1902781 RepID=A0ABV7FJZ3_9ALTE